MSSTYTAVSTIRSRRGVLESVTGRQRYIPGSLPARNSLMSSTASTLAADLGDLPTSELLTQGHAALEWIARYLDHPERVSVLSQVVPGEIREMLPTSPPEQGESLGD